MHASDRAKLYYPHVFGNLMWKGALVLLLVAGAAVGATVTLLDAAPVNSCASDKPCDCPSDKDCGECPSDKDCSCPSDKDCGDCHKECKHDATANKPSDCPEGHECKVDCNETPWERQCREQVCENHPESEDCAYMKWCNEFPDQCEERRNICHKDPEAEQCQSHPWCDYFPENCQRQENWEYREDQRHAGMDPTTHTVLIDSFRVLEMGVIIVAPDTPMINLNVTINSPEGMIASAHEVLYNAETNETFVHYRAESNLAGEWSVTVSGIGEVSFIVDAVGLF